MRLRSLPRPLGSLVLVVLGAVTVAPRAAAVDPLGINTTTPTPPAPGGTDQAVVARYWEIGRTRPFLSGTIDVGVAYLKPRFQAGYGRPFWSWIGVEAYPVIGLGGVGHYAGAAASIPGLTFRVGTRYFYPFSRSFLTPKPHFTRTDIELTDGPTGDYLALEGEVIATAPLFSGSIFGVFTGYRTAMVPDGYYLFEESLRTVMDPPYIWRARLGYLLAFGRDAAIRVGPVADVIGLPGRGELVVRGGVLASVAINASLEAQASLVPVLFSPDSTGLAGGDFGQLGVRFSWATGSKPDPERLRREVEPGAR